MFAKSAANDSLQSKAIQAVNEKWGEDVLQRSGRETIGIPVCKKKYAPFTFTQTCIEASGTAGNNNGSSSGVRIQVQRMYACPIHHAKRKALIEQHGVRKGWEPFGQWSRKKTEEAARREAIRWENDEKKKYAQETFVNEKGSDIPASVFSSGSSDEDDSSNITGSGTGSSDSDSESPPPLVYSDTANQYKMQRRRQQQPSPSPALTSICLNGACTWKMKSCYDDIYKEMHGHTESEAEDNNNIL